MYLCKHAQYEECTYTYQVTYLTWFHVYALILACPS